MLDSLCVGTHNKQSPFRQVCECGPYLLAIHYPLVSVANTFCRQTGEVRASTWLGEQLAPDFFTSEQGAEITRLLRIATPLNNCWTTHSISDWISCVSTRCTGLHKFLVNNLLELRRNAEATAADGEMHPRKTEVELFTQKVDWFRCPRWQLCQQIGYLGTD